MYRVLLVACGALASHSGFVTRGAEGRRLCGGGGGGGGGSLTPEECVLGAPREGTAYLCASRADATRENNYCFASWAFVDKDGADLKGRPRAAALRSAVTREASSPVKRLPRRFRRRA